MEDYKENTIKKIINKVIELDNDITIKKYGDTIILCKNYNDGNFLNKCIDLNEILRLEYIFGIDLTSEDIVNSLNEDLKECFEEIIPLYFYVGINYFDTNKIQGMYQNILDDHPLSYIRKIKSK